MAYDGTVPKFITVAITWGGEGDDPNLLRMRDFTPSVNPYMPISGGAEHFLAALESEIIPFAENVYRASGKRVLVGASLGGLFTSYAMLQKPDLFSGYMALSAPYALEQSYFESRLMQLSHSRPLKDARAYLAVGSLDTNQPQVKSFAGALKAHKLGADVKLKVVRGVGHAGVEPIAYTYGLQYVFERPKLRLPPRVLDRYLGTYESDLGLPPVKITRHKHQLQLQQEGVQGLDFFAESETTFYVNGIDYTLEFTKEGEVMTFVISVQGASYKFVRTSEEPVGE